MWDRGGATMFQARIQQLSRCFLLIVGGNRPQVSLHLIQKLHTIRMEIRSTQPLIFETILASSGKMLTR